MLVVSRSKTKKLQLTRDELRVLKECNRESFWFRCVPLGMMSVLGTQVLISRGYLSLHPRYGGLFKYMGAGLIAYIAGKLSYQNACRAKIMQLENSPLADAMRRGRRGTDILQEMSVPMGGMAGSFESADKSESPTKLHEDYNHTNIDTDQNVRHTGLDDSFRPRVDRESSLPQSDEKAQVYITHEDLRRRNREEYERKAATNQPFPAPSERSPSTQQYRPPPSETPPKYGRKNQYGDIIEE